MKSPRTSNFHHGVRILTLTLTIAICFLCTLPSTAQETRTISGTLTDENGYALPGVNIMIKGTHSGTITDLYGNYSIEAPIGSYLVYDFIGFGSKEVLVEALEAEDNELEDSVSTKILHHKIPKSDKKTLSPYFFIKSDNPETDRLPLKSTKASVTISGVIADVEVKQQYINDGNTTLEAVYIFPGSDNAAVYGMNMRIGNRLLIADIREKKQARKDYEKAKKQGKTATLLEQNRPNVFQMNVANILPGDTIEVSLMYTELLSAREGIYEFIYPTVVGPRYANETTDNKEEWLNTPYLSEGKKSPYTFDLNVHLNSGIPVKKLYSKTHAIKTNYTDTNSINISLDESETDGGNRDFILNYGLRGGKVESGILLYEGTDENFFLLMLEPPSTPEPEHIPGREYIFVIDISGSMSGFPLEVSKTAIKTLLQRLRPTDKFNIITFAGSSQMMWKESKPATDANIKHGLNFAHMKNAGGGTELKRALDGALKIKPEENYSRTFIVLTDGYVSFEKETFISVHKNLNKANLFAMGIGSSVNRYLIDGLAHAGMGEPYVATNRKEAVMISEKLIDYIEKPVLTNISIDFGDLQAYDYEPSSIPDVFAQRTILVYGKYKGNANVLVKVNGISGETHYTKRFNLKKAKSEDNSALKYLWARNKIKYLDDYAHYYTSGNSYQHTSDDNIKKEITALGLKYNLLTQYTSFIAVDSIIRNQNYDNVTVKQPLPLPNGVSNHAISSLSTEVNYGQVSLSPDLQNLQEVVVVGYGTQKKSCITGSVTSVNATEITEHSVTAAMQGAVSGVSVINNTGTPGAKTTVRIRGASTLSGNNAPLIVIDGILQTDPTALSDLNMENVDQVNILKDAAATAIYGSRASNGVIVVSTKSGDPYMNKIEFKAKAGFNYINSNKTADKDYLWYNDSVDKGLLQHYNLSYNYNKNNLTFYTSGSYHNNQGVIKSTSMKQFTTNNQFAYKLLDNKLDFDLTFHGASSTTKSIVPNYSETSKSDLTVTTINNKHNKIQTKGALSYQISEGLKLRTSISRLNNQQNFRNYYESKDESDRLIRNTLMNIGAKYNKYFSEHEVQLSVDYEHFTDQDELNWHSQQQTTNSSLYLLKDQAINIHGNYSYSDKYLFTVNYRSEVNISGIQEGKWVALPNISVGYILSNERFMSKLSLFSNLKLRYSVGKNGRSKLAKHYYATGLYSPIGITHPITNIIIPEELKREETQAHNLGIDFGFLHNRLTASLDYFINTTDNMFYLSQNSVSEYEWMNIGSYRNNGFDFDFRYHVMNNRLSNITLTFNIAKNNTSIEHLSTDNPVGVTRTVNNYLIGQELKEGAPIGTYYGYGVLTTDQTNKEIKLADQNKDGEINHLDRIAIANTNPKLYGGFLIDGSLKNWEFSTQFAYSYGNKVININRMYEYEEYSYNGNITAPSNTLLNTQFVEDGSYLRLSELTLRYNFVNLPGLRFIEDMQLSISTKNVFTLAKYKGQDPEFNNWRTGDFYNSQTLPGVDMNYYPVSKGIFLTLKLGF